MDNHQGFTTMIKRLTVSKKPVTHLIEAISEGDIEKCRNLVLNMDTRQINKLKRPKQTRYTCCVVTPLLWAVMNRCHDIAGILLSNGAAADRLGYFEEHKIVHKLSPLLRAIDHHDERMVDLLLRYGSNIYNAIPGPRLIEEEGGSVRYCRYMYPLDYCFGRKINICEKLLSQADMSREYGVDQHKCFCRVVNTYLKDVIDLRNLKYIHLCLQYGGIVCCGKQRNGNCSRSGCCSYLYDLVQSLSNFLRKQSLDQCVIGLINCLYFACCCDYMYQQSPVYVFPKLLADLMSTWESSKFECVHVVEKLSLDRLYWILEMAHTPSSLQDISRSVIRKYMNSCKPSDCSRLPLPSSLINFITFESTVDGIPYLLSFDCYN